MEEIIRSLKCTQCKNMLSSPLILPCGHAICSEHVTAGETSECHCTVCDIIHVVPEGGFARILALETILNANIQKAKFCAQYERAVGSLKEVEKKLDNFKLVHTNPDYFVSQTIGELKIETDLLREQFKLKIDERADEILKDLREYEQECHDQQRNPQDLPNRNKETDRFLQGVNEQIEKWKKTLDNFDSSEVMWKVTEKESQNELFNLEAWLGELKDACLLQKLHEYESKLVEFSRFQLKSEQEYRLLKVIFLLYYFSHVIA
jgi:hypothetical protein